MTVIDGIVAVAVLVGLVLNAAAGRKSTLESPVCGAPARRDDSASGTHTADVDMNLEVVIIPTVSSIDRTFAEFSDPDGNSWLFQEVTARVPGPHRPGGHDLRVGHRAGGRFPARVRRPRRAREAHRPGRTGLARLYAQYVIAEQSGTELPT